MDDKILNKQGLKVLNRNRKREERKVRRPWKPAELMNIPEHLKNPICDPRGRVDKHKKNLGGCHGSRDGRSVPDRSYNRPAPHGCVEKIGAHEAHRDIEKHDDQPDVKCVPERFNVERVGKKPNEISDAGKFRFGTYSNPVDKADEYPEKYRERLKHQEVDQNRREKKPCGSVLVHLE